MIYRLQISNILTISEMTIDLSAGIEGFVGPNAVGKSNILAAIEGILNGTSPDMIKDGKKKGTIRLEGLDDSGDVVTSVTRTQTPSSSTLKGMNLPEDFTPHAFLSTLFDTVALNPVRLISDNPVEYLKKHLPLKAEPKDLPKNMAPHIRFDLEGDPLIECKKQCDYYKQIRLATYKDKQHEKEVVAELKKELPPMPENDLLFTKEELDHEGERIIGELATVDSHNEKREGIEREIEDFNEQIVYYDGKDGEFYSAIERLEKYILTEGELLAESKGKIAEATLKKIGNHNDYIKELEARILHTKQTITECAAESETASLGLETACKEKITGIRNKIELNKQKIDGFGERKTEIKGDIVRADKRLAATPPKNTEDLETAKVIITEKYKRIEERTALSRRHEQVLEHEKAHIALKKRHEIEDSLYKYFDKELPSMLIERCDLHVDGLSFEENELYVNGRPIMRLSSSERTAVAVKIVAQLAKAKGHVCCSIDGLEIFDKEHRDRFLEAIKDTGLKMLYTRHGKVEHKHETLVGE